MAMHNPNELREKRNILRTLFVLGALVFFIVGLGGYVRLSGSGLSIPHWPLINGSLLWPQDEPGWELLMEQYHEDVAGLTIPKVPGRTEMEQFRVMFWIEYSHRAVASVIGLVWLVLLAQVLMYREAGRPFRSWTVGIGIMIFLQALLGGLVVLKQLPAEKVALHLTTAFVILAAILWTMLKIMRPAQAGAGPNPLRWWARLAAGATLAQIFIGGLVAGSGAGYMINTWPKMGDHWVPPGMWSETFQPIVLNLLENQITVQFIHRWFAVTVVAVIVAMVFRSFTLGVSPVARWSLRLVVGIVTLQFILGVLTLLWAVPVHMGLTHQMVGLVLFEVLVVILYEATHRVVVTEEQQAATLEASEQEIERSRAVTA
ncbi:MAG: COX15/CtaA family protein [Candidatus Sumerlaeia bacterium]|nr:COX15/CtaA family protein [Candidatus Sumerlaeia bacterium]